LDYAFYFAVLRRGLCFSEIGWMSLRLHIGHGLVIESILPSGGGNVSEEMAWLNNFESGWPELLPGLGCQGFNDCDILHQLGWHIMTLL